MESLASLGLVHRSNKSTIYTKDLHSFYLSYRKYISTVLHTPRTPTCIIWVLSETETTNHTEKQIQRVPRYYQTMERKKNLQTYLDQVPFATFAVFTCTCHISIYPQSCPSCNPRSSFFLFTVSRLIACTYSRSMLLLQVLAPE